MLLTAVVVTYNSVSAIRSTLASLKDSLSHLESEIVVIDNASTDGSADLADQIIGDRGVVLRKSENVGFSAAINQGAKRARGEYLLIMNDDVVISSDTIDRLVASLQENPRVAMVGPVLHNPDGSPTYTMFRWLHGWREELARFRDRLFGTSVRTTLPTGPEVDVVEVGALFAACALIETEFFREIGGFNDAFFVYGQDVDLSHRIASLQRTVAVDTRAVAIHHQDEDLARRPEGSRLAEQMRVARDLYYRIWLPRASRVLLNLWHMIGRADQPARALYHLNRAISDGGSLRNLRRPAPIESVFDGYPNE